MELAGQEHHSWCMEKKGSYPAVWGLHLVFVMVWIAGLHGCDFCLYMLRVNDGVCMCAKHMPMHLPIPPLLIHTI